MYRKSRQRYVATSFAHLFQPVRFAALQKLWPVSGKTEFRDWRNGRFLSRVKLSSHHSFYYSRRCSPIFNMIIIIIIICCWWDHLFRSIEFSQVTYPKRYIIYSYYYYYYYYHQYHSYDYYYYYCYFFFFNYYEKKVSYPNFL